jgi:hypothetical protein
VGDERERLLAVKRGEVSWYEVESWMARLTEEADRASTTSPLPAAPDHARVEDFLMRARRSSALSVLDPDPDHEVVQGVVPGGGVREA